MHAQGLFLRFRTRSTLVGVLTVAAWALGACQSEERTSTGTSAPGAATSVEGKVPERVEAPSAPRGQASPEAAAPATAEQDRPTADAVKGRDAATVAPTPAASPPKAAAATGGPPKERATALPVEPAPSSVASSAASSAPAAAPELPPAAPNSADAVAEKVDAIYGPIQRFSARFEQKYTAKIAGTTKNSEGSCLIKRPGKVSFSYQKPNKNRVVSDGVTLKIYEAENQQMFTRSVASTEYPGALAFILGKGLRHSFEFSFNESAKWEGGPVLVGTPRVPNPGYEKVLFYIDEELLRKGDPACVRRVLVMDAQGNRNRFDFIQVSQPADIADLEFVFTPPEGTTVVQ